MSAGGRARDTALCSGTCTEGCHHAGRARGRKAEGARHARADGRGERGTRTGRDGRGAAVLCFLAFFIVGSVFQLQFKPLPVLFLILTLNQTC